MDLEQFSAEVHAFANTLLAPYNERLERRRTRSDSPHAKEFNDPIWRTILLEGPEVAILDSPLLQRLRRIRQLGVVHYVYPGAMHTRFEHTLGVVHQVQSLVDSLNRSAKRSVGQPVIDETRIRLLRLSGLLHDIGHGLMSHVSENALASDGSVAELCLEFKKAQRLEDPHLAEIVSYLMTEAPETRRLLRLACPADDTDYYPEHAVAFVQSAILGKPVADDAPLLHELISGPFDADKLDYLARDATMTGVPVVTDIPRLVSKMRAVLAPKENLPATISDSVRAIPGSYTLTGVAWSGGRTLDEQMLGRSLLFDKVYQHHKVRAAEAMVSSALLQVGAIAAKDVALSALVLEDDDFLTLTEQRVAVLADRALGTEDQPATDIALDITTRLRERRLFVRAFAWVMDPEVAGLKDSGDQEAALRQILLKLKKPAERALVIERIATLVREMLESLGEASLLESFPDPTLHAYICIDPPPTTSGRSLLARAHLITDDGTVMPFRDAYPETEAWADAYVLTRSIGYVFTPESLARYVHIATEIVFLQDLGMSVTAVMRAHCRRASSDPAGIRARLRDNGFLNGLPADVLPMPEVLVRASSDRRIAEIVSRVSGYLGPVDALEDERDNTLTAERVRDWLRQFRQDESVEAALCLLEATRFVGRADVAGSLDRFLDANPQFHGGLLCPIGTAKDSSAIVAYYANDVAEKYGMTVTTILEAGAIESPVVFIDDLTGSGRQVVSIFEDWFGIDQTEDLGEQRQSRLEEATIEGLRRVPTAVVFAAGLAEGLAYIQERLTAEDFALDVVVWAELRDEALPRVGTVDFPDQVGGEPFAEELRRIGEQLLMGKYEEDKIVRRGLGYGNLGLLVVFPYNTPAQTVTCLWERGTVDGVEWFPLVPRRRKR